MYYVYVGTTNDSGEAPPQSPLTTELFLQFMGRDKKVSAGQLRLVLIQGPLGSVTVTNKFDQRLLENVVAKYCSG